MLAIALKLLFPLLLAVAAVGWFITQPAPRTGRPSVLAVDPGRLRSHVVVLSRSCHPRDWRHPENLARCADYLAGEFARAGAAVAFQTFTAEGREYRNVIARFGAGRGERVILCAHYDAFEGTPGADDNASGVAVLLETAYLLGRWGPAREVELVATVLEEPPFFRTEAMGSAVHARSISGEKGKIAGVIVLEMVGCFRDGRGSQSYPVPLLRLFYPERGNFLAVVGSLSQGGWVRRVKEGMAGATDLPVRSLRAPAMVPGVDFSDHLSYWAQGIPAVMVTDTAFYRNLYYHTAGDTAERLDYGRMGKVAVAVYETLQALQRPER